MSLCLKLLQNLALLAAPRSPAPGGREATDHCVSGEAAMSVSDFVWDMIVESLGHPPPKFIESDRPLSCEHCEATVWPQRLNGPNFSYRTSARLVRGPDGRYICACCLWEDG